MTAPVIGTNCHITLTHPNVNSGDPYPFILAYDPSVKGSSVSVEREVDESTAKVSIRLFMTVLLADDLKNPDGSDHTYTRAQMYTKILEYLECTESLAIDTVMGCFTGIAPIGFSATELHQVDVSHIACQFTNISTYHPPIDSTIFFACKWDGDRKWNNSYWR